MNAFRRSEFARSCSASFLILALMIGALAAGVSGCSHQNPGPSPQARGGAAVRTFDVRGVVVEVGFDRRTATIRHDAIPGYMPAMTMEFTVVDSRELERIAAGDTIRFKLVVHEQSHWIESLRILAAAPANGSPELLRDPIVSTPALKPGDPMPDVVLSDELGRSIRLSDFHGKALAFTFVFSRCPLPEFCPRMSRSFQTARSILESRNGKPIPWQFLSISFDPEFDKPAVLRRYARSYRGENTNQWLFASVSTNALPVLSRQLDLSINRDQGSFSHNLRTVVLDPAGRIHTLFAGNQWTAQQLAESLVDAAQAAPR